MSHYLHIVIAAVVFYFSEILSFGQIIVSSDSGSSRTEDINVHVLEKATRLPIPWATVFICPENDTTIVNFTVTGKEGNARLESVPRGEYELNVEILGYVPFREQVSVIPGREFAKEIFLEESSEFIDAARVTAFIAPMEQNGDTLVYNASAFKFSSSAALKDLLMKMPGVTVEGDKILVNSKAVTELTVNGKTFFFGDVSVALNNLPARFVNRIKVVDANRSLSVSEQLSGIRGNRTIMDVELKEEYSKGFFGNVSADVGTGRVHSSNEDSSLKGVAGLSALGSLYDEDRQWTSIIEASNKVRGFGWNGKVGTNFYTSSIKGFDTSVSAVFESERTDSQTNSERQSFQTTSEIATLYDENASDVTGNEFRVESEIKSLPGRCGHLSLDICPYVAFRRGNHHNASITRTVSTDAKFSGEEIDKGTSDIITYGARAEASLDSLGKDGRKLSFYLKYDGASETSADSVSSIMTGSNMLSDLKLLRDNSLNYGSLNGSINYIEPFTKFFSIQATTASMWNYSKAVVDAKDAVTTKTNPAYSSDVSNSRLSLVESLFATFHLSDSLSISVGGKGEGVLNRTKAIVQSGVPSTGYGAWEWCLYPYLHILRTKPLINQFYIGAGSRPLSREDIQPGFRHLSATEYKIGNIFMKPSFMYRFMIECQHKKMTYVHLIVDAHIDNRAYSSAVWSDLEGTRHTMSVNSDVPTYDMSSFFSISRTFGRNSNWRFNFQATGKINSDVSYINSGRLPVIDESSFDYSEFMKGIWGGTEGDVFYSGKSGFVRNRYVVGKVSANLDMEYSGENLTAGFEFSPSLIIADYENCLIQSRTATCYSFNPYLDYYFTDNLYAESSLCYSIYKGYGASFDCSVWNLGMSINKDFDNFTISLDCSDLLDRSRNISCVCDAGYLMSSATNCLGRTIMLSLTFNFGKGGASAGNKADSYRRKFTQKRTII